MSTPISTLDSKGLSMTLAETSELASISFSLSGEERVTCVLEEVKFVKGYVRYWLLASVIHLQLRFLKGGGKEDKEEMEEGKGKRGKGRGGGGEGEEGRGRGRGGREGEEEGKGRRRGRGGGEGEEEGGRGKGKRSNLELREGAIFSNSLPLSSCNTFSTHAIHMLHTCHTHATHMPYTCRRNVITIPIV